MAKIAVDDHQTMTTTNHPESPSTAEEYVQHQDRSDLEPAFERLDFENSALLRWLEYATAWKGQSPFESELTIRTMDTIGAELEVEIRDANGDAIQDEENKFWAAGEYDPEEIAATALQPIAWWLEQTTSTGRPFGKVDIHVLPWFHEKLSKLRATGVEFSLEGLCERYDNADGCGFQITLSSSATPMTVLHEIAHVLAFGDEGRLIHGPVWLLYFLLLVAGRYWELDLSQFLRELEPISQIPAAE